MTMTTAHTQDLRLRAEALFTASENLITESTSPEEITQLFHELKVHQIELQMQNEELRRAQADLHYSQARYFDLYDLAPVGYMTLSDKKLIQEVNLTAATMFGIVRSALVKEGISRILPNDNHQLIFYKHLKQCVESSAVQEWEMRLLRADGEQFWAHLQVAPGQNEECWLVINDITDRKNAEEKINQLHLEMEQRVTERTAQLKVAYQEMESFAYSVSHDLRAPLRSIDGFSLALLEDYGDKLDDGGKDYLRRVRCATQKMAQLIDDILKLSRITRCELTLETVNLTKIAEIIADELHSTEPERKVEFVIKKGLKVNGDLRLLKVVLDNLLGNAWKYTSSHAKSRIEFGRSKVDGKTAYFIRDDGAGFDTKYADKLFATFQRLHTEQEFPGTGIGLSLVQHIIHRHGGTVWAEGAVEQGATLWFTVGG